MMRGTSEFRRLCVRDLYIRRAFGVSAREDDSPCAVDISTQTDLGRASMTSLQLSFIAVCPIVWCMLSRSDSHPYILLILFLRMCLSQMMREEIPLRCAALE